MRLRLSLTAFILATVFLFPFLLLKILGPEGRGDPLKSSLPVKNQDGFINATTSRGATESKPMKDLPVSGSNRDEALPPLTASGPLEPLKRLPRLARPGPTSSPQEKLHFKMVDASGGSVAPDASIFQAGTSPFLLQVRGQATVMHAALDEVYLPPAFNHGIAEIVQIPAVEDLAAWQEAALQVSDQAQLVLYRPEEPREDENMLLLGTSVIVEAPNPEDAQAFMASEGLAWVDSPDYAPGRYLAAAPSPMHALRVLRRAKSQPGFALHGDFGRAQVPRNNLRSATPSRASGGQRFAPNDPLYSSQWHLANTNVGSGLTISGIDANVGGAWQLFSGTNVRIGIIDDGLQINHPDLVGNMPGTNLPALHRDWNDATPNDPTPGVNNPHGTACAGVAAAKGGNNLGVTGAAPDATLVGLRLIAAPSTDQQEAQAFAHSNNLIQIKSNSWGPTDTGRTIEGPGSLAAASLQTGAGSGRGAKGTIFIWAAGNGGVSDNSNYDGYANSIYAIAVSAINNQGTASFYSERGGNIALCAPSSGGSLGITTTDLTGDSGYSTGDYTSSFGGTSSACPLVAGVAALVLQANPDLGWRDLKEILMRSATKVDTGNTTWVNNAAGLSFSSQYGGGMVNATAAVELAQDWEVLEPMTSASGTSGAIRLLVPDNDAAGVQASIPISANFRVESVAVTVSALHLWRGDLVASVISPSGTEVQLTTLRFDPTDHLNNVTFTTPHFTGETSAGTWKIRMADVDPGVIGLFTAASLTVYGSNSPRAPANDNFENAQEFDNVDVTFNTSNRGATRQNNEPRHADQIGGGSLWWLYRPSTSGYLTLDTSGSAVGDTLLAVYRGDTLTGLTLLYADDNSAGSGKARIARIPVVAGENLRIAVDGKNRARGAIRLRASLEIAALHDLFADARPQTGNSWSHTWSNAGTGATAYSAQSGELPHAIGVPASRSVWYAWRATANGTATIHTRGSAFDTVLAVYQGSRVDRLRQIASNDNEPGRTSSRVTFGVRNGDVYYLAVDGKAGATGAYTISASLGGSVPPPPGNDNFSNAIPISGAPLSLSGVNLSATGQTGEPNGSIRTSVWYRWTAPRSGVVTLSTQGSGFDTTLGAYSGAALAAVTVLPAFPSGTGNAFNDNALPGQRWSQVRFSAIANNVYYICVDGARGATGRYQLRVSY